MKFKSDVVSFGRHETFALRYSWLTKGFNAISDLKVDLTDSDNATVVLGVGKNMVGSIRHWLRACQMTEADSSTPTSIGTLILGADGHDRYLEDEATLWLVHWLLASNPQFATSWYWFFNKFHRSEFTAEEVQTALSDFTRDKVVKTRRPAASTIKSDSFLLPRMYAGVKQTRLVSLEDSLDAPLALLGLISQSSNGYVSKTEARPNLPVGIVGYALTQLMAARGVSSLPIEDLLFSRDDFPALGSVFRMTENDLVTKLEQLVSYIDGIYEVRETAGIHQVYQLRAVHPELYLNTHYADFDQGVAA